MKKPMFNIGDEVYHIIPGSPKGIVLDIIYYYTTEKYSYLISLGFGEEVVCRERELTDERQIEY